MIPLTKNLKNQATVAVLSRWHWCLLLFVFTFDCPTLTPIELPIAMYANVVWQNILSCSAGIILDKQRVAGISATRRLHRAKCPLVLCYIIVLYHFTPYDNVSFQTIGASSRVDYLTQHATSSIIILTAFLFHFVFQKQMETCLFAHCTAAPSSTRMMRHIPSVLAEHRQPIL